MKYITKSFNSLNSIQMISLKKCGSSFLLIIFSSLVSFCQIVESDTLKKRIKESAELMANSLTTKDYETFIKYMEPNTVIGLGGKEKLIEIFKKGLPNGSEITWVGISTPSDTVISNNEIQCTLIETIKLKVKEGTLINKASLIGVSRDKGENWYFIDANRPFDDLKKTYPNLSNRLIIEPWSPPVLLRE